MSLRSVTSLQDEDGHTIEISCDVDDSTGVIQTMHLQLASPHGPYGYVEVSAKITPANLAKLGSDLRSFINAAPKAG